MMTEDEAMKRLAEAATDAFHAQIKDVADRFPNQKLDADEEAKLFHERVYNSILSIIETLPTGTVNHLLATLLAQTGCKEMSQILKDTIRKNAKSN